MKKILIVLFTLLLLCGCSNSHNSKIANGEEVIFVDSDGKNYTKADLYDDMMTGSSASSYLTNDLILKLAKLENVDLETIKKEAQDDANEAIEAGQEYYITYYYGSVDNYIKQMTPYLALNELKKQYVEADLNTYVEDYLPFQAQIIYFDEMENATNTLKDINENGKEFIEAATLNGYTEEITTTLYHNAANDLPTQVIEYVVNNGVGVSYVIETENVTTVGDEQTSTPRYYLVNIISKDVADFKDEFIESVLEDVDQNTVLTNLLNKYEVNIYDQRAYDLLTSTYEVLK